MKFQILIPRHNEPESIIKCLLDSIMVQRSINRNDFGVIIYDDGSKEFLDDKFIFSYPYTITYIKCEENHGVSVARNILIDKSVAEYIMFCDADDCFVDVRALYLIFNNIDTNHFDVLYSRFAEETVDSEGKMIYLDRHNDGTFIHGKVFRRDYIVNENIRFPEDAKFNEDSFFVYLAIYCTEKKLYIDIPFYLWCYNPKSTVRGFDNYVLNSLPNMISNDERLVYEFLKRGNKEKAQDSLLSTACEIYYDTHISSYMTESNKELIDKIVDKFARYFIKYQTTWSEISEDHKKWYRDNHIAAMEELRHKKMDIEEDFNNWIFKTIATKYKDNPDIGIKETI